MKSFLAALRNLVLPYGATSGERIVLDSTDGEIDIYNAANVRVVRISPDGIQLYDSVTGALSAAGSLSAGSEGTPGWISYAASFENPSYGALTDSTLEFGTPGVDYFSYPGISTFQNSGVEDPFFMSITCGALDGTTPYPTLSLEGAVPGHNSTTYLTGTSGLADFQVDGVIRSGSRAWGTVTITPVANVPTSVAVTGLHLTGANPRIQISAETSVPGTQVTGVGFNNVSASGFTAWLTRTNTTPTLLNWTAESG